MEKVLIGVLITGAAAGGGYLIYRHFKKKREIDEARLAAARAGTTPAAAQAVSRAPTTGELIAEIGGRAAAEGAKYLILGSAGYAAASAQRQQIRA